MKSGVKKAILSFFVVFSFIFYSFGQRKPAIGNMAGQNPPESDSAGTNQPLVNSKPSAENNPSVPVASGGTQSNTGSGAKTSPPGQFKDGVYRGSVADAYYGNVQVEAVIQNGKIADVRFLDYPSDRDTSIRINTQAMPYLSAEAVQAQSSNVDIVSGATDTSSAFMQSLASALTQAK